MATMHVTANPGQLDIVITREFDAPRELVFRAYTDPALIPKWWGPESVVTTVDALEARPGGRWHYAQSSAEGESYGAHMGFFHQAIAPERLVYTYEFEMYPGHVGLVTNTFEERDGKTLMTETSVYPSVEDRDGVIASGMEGGAAESMNRLDALLETL